MNANDYVMNETIMNDLIEQLKGNPKVIQCIDCGEWIEVDSTNNRTCRCIKCQKKYNRIIKTQKQRQYRS